ncbi:MAG: hypothetical protein JWO64_1026 [Hyphomicrobiales bacterium]|jgi:hypothetical protein|nr:hypothetical protein [Hyphomicrobiales bacterium]
MRAMFIGLAVVAFIPALAHAQSRDLNNEAVCSSPGYSMDPRCVGGQSPSYDYFASGQRGLIIVQPQLRRR